MSPKRLIERFYNEVWNRADEVVAREILHPEFCFRGSLGEEKRGPEGLHYISANDPHSAIKIYLLDRGDRRRGAARRCPNAIRWYTSGPVFRRGTLRPGDFMVWRRFFCDRWRQDLSAFGYLATLTP